MTAAIEIRDLHAAYDGANVLSGVDLRVDSGEVVALLGRNGVGKITLLNALFNLGPRVSSRISVKGHAVFGWPTYRIARPGVGLVAQGRGVFAPLTAHESLSPKAVEDILVTHITTLASQGLTVVPVEQNLALALRVASRIVVLCQGRVAFDGAAHMLAADHALPHRLLGV